jgi:hypothetical protein
MIILISIFMAIVIIGMGQSALMHFYGFMFGIILGLAFYPRLPSVTISDSVDKIFKIFAAGFIGLSIILALLI